MLRDFLADFLGSFLLVTSALLLLDAFLQWSPA